MLEEKDVLRSTAPISSAMETSRCRNSSNSMGSCFFICCARSFFAGCEVHQEAGDLLPSTAFGLLDHIAVGAGFGANPQHPRSCLLWLGGAIGGGPGLAAVFGAVFFVLAAIQSGVDPERPVRGRIEVEALNGCHAAFVKDGLLTPGLTAVGGDQEKWVARRALQIGAGNPAGLRIDKLDLVESGGM